MDEPASTLADPVWASSAAAQLCGWPGAEPVALPAGLPAVLALAAERVASTSGRIGQRVDIDPLTVLAERVATHGVRRRGQVSPAGFARLHRCADGWIGLSMARQADVEVVPAWLELDGRVVDGLDVGREGDRAEIWQVVDDRVGRRPWAEVVLAGAELGLPLAGLGEEGDRQPIRATPHGPGAPVTDITGLRVVDLSALWAGPLCTRVLADAGADVVKVESITRPDGARGGPAAFFGRMHAGKRSVALDLATAPGRDALAALVASAEVVVEASRPRALEGLGIAPSAVLGDRSTATRAWLSITGHGRRGPGANRVAFGDDAAVAGGAVGWKGTEPCFAGDALADPVAGLLGAAAVLEALADGGRWMLDLALARAAACVAGPVAARATSVVPSPAGSGGRRRQPGSGPALGQHTHEVLRELGLA